jgi:hypothetical protein
MTARRAAAAFVLGAALCACGGGSDAPTTQPLPPSASGLDFVLLPALNGASEIVFTWSGANATSYRVEIGQSSGAADVATFDAGASTSYTWSRVPVGNLYARVRPDPAGGGGNTSNEVLVGSIDPRRMVDALVFGYGPLAVAGNVGRSLTGGAWQDRVLGWQPGSSFDVVLADEVPAPFASSAEMTAAQIGPATRGTVTARLASRRPDADAAPLPGEVVVRWFADDAALREDCACAECVGCARTYYQGSFARRAQIALGPSSSVATMAHELGHVIGLAHVITAAGMRPPFTMGLTTDGRFSSSGRLDRLDPATVRMLQDLNDMGFTAGTSRRQLEAAGIVLPEAGTSLARLPPTHTVIERSGLETVVLKPVCQ